MKTIYWCALSLVLVGCGGRFDDYCAERIDCLDGNDDDLAACIASNEGDRNAIEKYGCDEEYEDFFACAEDKSDCVDDQYVVEGDDCSDEAEDLLDCVDDGSDIGD